MVTQTIEIFSEWPDEANTVCRARHKETRALIASSAVLDAPDPSGVVYLPQFTDLPADEYFFALETSTGQLMSYGYATVTLTTATFRLYGVRAAELPALQSTALSVLEDTGTTLPAQIGTPVGASVSADIAAVKADTATLLERVTTTVATLWANLTAMITGSGASAKYTVTALENAPAGEGGGGSTTISDEDIQEIVAGVTAVAPRICDSSAGTFRMRAGDTWIQDFTVTTTGADKFIVAVKNNAADEDSAAVLLIDSTDGLERINGAVPDDAGDASIATGAAKITVTVESNITLMIVPGKYVVTVKKLDVGSDATPISTASLTVFAPGVSEIST